MKKLINEIKELAPYLLIAPIIVGLILGAVAYLMPTAKELEPAARVFLKMIGG